MICRRHQGNPRYVLRKMMIRFPMKRDECHDKTEQWWFIYSICGRPALQPRPHPGRDGRQRVSKKQWILYYKRGIVHLKRGIFYSKWWILQRRDARPHICTKRIDGPLRQRDLAYSARRSCRFALTMMNYALKWWITHWKWWIMHYKWWIVH